MYDEKIQLKEDSPHPDLPESIGPAVMHESSEGSKISPCVYFLVGRAPCFAVSA